MNNFRLLEKIHNKILKIMRKTIRKKINSNKDHHIKDLFLIMKNKVIKIYKMMCKYLHIKEKILL